MQPVDFLRAAGVGVGVLVGTLIASVPMVAVYAHVINPGQLQRAYDAGHPPTVLTVTFFLSLFVKRAGALLGARLGQAQASSDFLVRPHG